MGRSATPAEQSRTVLTPDCRFWSLRCASARAWALRPSSSRNDSVCMSGPNRLTRELYLFRHSRAAHSYLLCSSVFASPCGVLESFCGGSFVVASGMEACLDSRRKEDCYKLCGKTLAGA